MICPDFRRRILQDPFANDADLLQHEENCPACADYAREVRAQEVQLRALLNNTPVPADLPDKIRHKLGIKKRRQTWFRMAWAMAASLFVVVGSFWLVNINSGLLGEPVPLAQNVLQHVEKEQHHYDVSKQVPHFQLNALFAQFKAKPSKQLGQVNFAAICPMGEHKGVHLAINGEMGPVTVFFMPQEHIEQPIDVASTQLQGEITPTHWGSIAVIGEPGEPISNIAQHMRNSVAWPNAVAAIQHMRSMSALASR